MKDKIVFHTFAYWEIDDFECYLEQMARKGFLLKKLSSLYMTFEKTEPQEVSYKVEISPKGKEMDWGQSDDTLEYSEYCEAAGYELVDSLGKCCVFRAKTEEKRPIFTEEERYETLKKAVVIQSLWSIMCIFVLYFFNSPLSPWNDSWISTYFFDDIWILEILLHVIFIFTLFHFISGYLLVKKCYNERQVDGAVYYGYQRPTKKKIPWSRVWIIAIKFFVAVTIFVFCIAKHWWGGLILTFLITFVFTAAQIVMGQIRPTGARSLMIAIILAIVFAGGMYVVLLVLSTNESFSNIMTGDEEDTVTINNEEELPLSLKDFKNELGSFDDAYVDSSSSIWGEWASYRIYYEPSNEWIEELKNNMTSEEYEGWEDEDGVPLENLEYTVYHTNQTWLQNLLWRDIKNAVKKSKIDPYRYGLPPAQYEKVDVTDEWGVEEALRVCEKDEEGNAVNFGWSEYFVKDGDTIFRISYGKEYTVEQMAIIKEKLEGAR